MILEALQLASGTPINDLERNLWTPTLEILRARFRDGLSHEMATQELERLKGEDWLSQLDTWRLIIFMNIARAGGLFAGSMVFLEAIRLQSSRRFEGGHPPKEIDFYVALVSGNLERAQWSYRAVKHLGLERSQKITQAYVDLWYGREPIHARAQHQKTHAVSLVGPGILDELAADRAEGDPIARVIGPGVTKWNRSTDPFNGTLDYAYAASGTTKWLSNLHSPLEISASLIFVPHGRRSPRVTGPKRKCTFPSAVFMNGLPNMGPTSMFDLLIHEAEIVNVYGINFHASKNAYRSEDVRVSPTDGRTKNQMGSYGSQFERCRSLAFHDCLANLRFATNLRDGGGISFCDSRGSQVASLSDEEYMTILDQLYGIDKH